MWVSPFLDLDIDNCSAKDLNDISNEGVVQRFLPQVLGLAGPDLVFRKRFFFGLEDQFYRLFK